MYDVYRTGRIVIEPSERARGVVDTSARRHLTKRVIRQQGPRFRAGSRSEMRTAEPCPLRVEGRQEGRSAKSSARRCEDPPVPIPCPLSPVPHPSLPAASSSAVGADWRRLRLLSAMQTHLLWHNAGQQRVMAAICKAHRIWSQPLHCVGLVEPILPARTGGVVFFLTARVWHRPYSAGPWPLDVVVWLCEVQ